MFSEAASVALGVKEEEPDCDIPDWEEPVEPVTIVEMTINFEGDVQQPVSDSAEASLDQDALPASCQAGTTSNDYAGQACCGPQASGGGQRKEAGGET